MKIYIAGKITGEQKAEVEDDSIEKSVLLNSGASKKAVEKLFIPKHQRKLYNNLMKRR